MARQNTSYLQGSPARKRPSFSRSPKTCQLVVNQVFIPMLTRLSVVKPLGRSLADHRAYRVPKGRPLPSYNRFAPATGNLSNIQEENMEPEGSSKLRDEVYRNFHTNTFQDDDFDGTEDEDDMADWDEESTLVAMLHDE